MAYHAGLGLTVVHGGAGGTRLLDDTWGWDGSNWRRLFADQPGTRIGHALAYDAARRVLVFFGGYSTTDGTGNRQDTWEWAGVEVQITTQPTGQTVPDGSAAVMQIVASGNEPLGYQWRHDGVPLRDDARVGGSTGPTLTIDPVQPGDEGAYDVIVQNLCTTIVSDAAALTIELECPGDLDHDRDVDLSDLGLILTDFGCTIGSCPGDADGDGDTDLADLGIVLVNYGATCR